MVLLYFDSVKQQMCAYIIHNYVTIAITFAICNGLAVDCCLMMTDDQTIKY